MDEMWLIQRFKVAWVTFFLSSCSSAKWLFRGPEDTHFQPGQQVLHFSVLNLLYNIVAILPAWLQVVKVVTDIGFGMNEWIKIKMAAIICMPLYVAS